MKKTKLLALTLAVAIMLVGAGYAYWSEDASIKNAVTTGELEFAFRNPVTKQETLLSVPSANVNNSDNNILDVKWDNVSPGAYYELYVGLQNTGTIDAGITNFDVIGNADELEHVYVSFISVHHGGKILGRVNCYKKVTELEDFIQNYSEFEKILPIDLTVEDQDVKLEIGFYIDHEATEDDLPENKTFNFRITADVLQINEINPELNRVMIKH